MTGHKCEYKVPGARPGRLRRCNVTPAPLYTIYRDNDPFTQTYRCSDHEPLFSDGSIYTVVRR